MSALLQHVVAFPDFPRDEKVILSIPAAINPRPPAPEKYEDTKSRRF